MSDPSPVTSGVPQGSIDIGSVIYNTNLLSLIGSSSFSLLHK